MHNHNTRWIITVGFVVILLAGGIVAALYWQSTQARLDFNDTWIYVRHGVAVEDVEKQLQEAGIDTQNVAYMMARKRHRLEGALERGAAGAYLLKNGMTADEVVRKIARRQQDPVKLTFIGTRTLPELAGRLSHHIEADSIDVLKAIYDPSFLKECGCDSATIISIFLPDTYEVYWDITPEKLMQKMQKEYKRFWDKKRQAQAQTMNITPLQACILCSIAEEETSNRTERGIVARLYWNRLQKRMKLQADPTVKYALGDFNLRRILNVHLKAKSPYNTYQNIGLPPGPIRVVEKATIDAFLQSTPHNYLYMCAKDDFSGQHNFATTLKQHNKNADLYHKALKRNKIR